MGDFHFSCSGIQIVSRVVRDTFLRNSTSPGTLVYRDTLSSFFIFFFKMSSLYSLLLVLRLCESIRDRHLRRRVRHYLTCVDLHSRSEPSAWRVLSQSSSESGFLDTFGVSTPSFHYLCERMSLFITPSPQASYRVPDLLAVSLHYLSSRLEQRNLCFIYARPPSTLNRMLQEGLEALGKVLQSEPKAQIIWPSPMQMRQYAHIIKQRHPALENVFGFVDGVFFQVPNSPDPQIQNAYYNGWKSCCAVSNILVFAPDGTIIYARLNAPGSWHDSVIARKLYNTLENETPDPFRIVGDSAFVNSSKLLVVGNGETLAEEEQLVSLRQAAEWGMHEVQSKFPRLNCLHKLKFNTKYTLNIISLCCYLYNYRTRTEKLNQITTVYCAPGLEEEDESR